MVAAACQPSRPPCSARLSSELCEDIGQLLLVGFGGVRPTPDGRRVAWRDPHGLRFASRSDVAQDIGELGAGGVLLFRRNVASPAQLGRLIADLQSLSAHERARRGLSPAPLLVAIDQEGGRVDRLPARLGFAPDTPSARALGEIAKMSHPDPELARSITFSAVDATSMELHQLGVNLNLAPCVDVDVNPDSPALGELGRSFSSDPEIVADLAGVSIRAMHANGLLATLKHFPGQGSASSDPHGGKVDVTQSYQADRELLPYRRLLARVAPDVILVGHIVNGRIDRSPCKPGAADDPDTWCPASLSRATVSGLLRQELGFQGVVAADDLAMGAIAREYPLDVALERALDAGVDLFILGNDRSHATPRLLDTLVSLVEERRVSEARIRESARRVAALKERLAAGGSALQAGAVGSTLPD